MYLEIFGIDSVKGMRDNTDEKCCNEKKAFVFKIDP